MSRDGIVDGAGQLGLIGNQPLSPDSPLLACLTSLPRTLPCNTSLGDVTCEDCKMMRMSFSLLANPCPCRCLLQDGYCACAQGAYVCFLFLAAAIGAIAATVYWKAQQTRQPQIRCLAVPVSIAEASLLCSPGRDPASSMLGVSTFLSQLHSGTGGVDSFSSNAGHNDRKRAYR